MATDPSAEDKGSSPRPHAGPSKGDSQRALDLLLRLTRTLSEERSLSAALQATAETALALLPCDHASVRLFDEERRKLMAIARTGEGHTEPPAQFRAGQGVIGIVADTGKSALVCDAEHDARFVDTPIGFDVLSIVAVPLWSGGRVVGVLSASSAEAEQFDEADMELLQLLANCTAPAIETARLAMLAVTDDLTRAYNYRYWNSRLREEAERASRYGDEFSLLMMDLDHFKRVNDRYGHQTGDGVLRGFVERVRTQVRATDVLIRRGGEEFVLLMPVTGAHEAATVAERIRECVANQPIEAEDHAVPLTVSVGIATYRGKEAPSRLEARADRALYQAKQLGRNTVVTASPDEGDEEDGPIPSRTAI